VLPPVVDDPPDVDVLVEEDDDDDDDDEEDDDDDDDDDDEVDDLYDPHNVELAGPPENSCPAFKIEQGSLTHKWSAFVLKYLHFPEFG